ncbi:DNA-directed RNA polymerase subunit alpha [Candidatus Parcubacteria bacterium]|jgi:DNA-directed RNA polymerase subunit alpha|nr:DNA-directed RNA polymerase subunit alpha [Candidatus Parcubacteria bacterium]
MFSFPTSPKIIEKEKNTARFELRELYPGYGVTVGNALRRVLLSSLPGTAVTLVKIKNVSHEFSTLPGVYEDVVSILLNLKQLRFRVYSDEPIKISLSAKGEKEIKGKDFKIPSQIELVNQDAHIADLTKKSAELEMEILVEKGLGYEPAERKKKEKLEVGEIAVDAIFTPVRKVNYVVENMRVGERTDYDLLKIEIETDGTITPEQAIFSASEILVKHFSLFVEKFKTKEEPKKESQKTAKPKFKKTKKQAQPKKSKVK